jgi:hypothetical protein
VKWQLILREGKWIKAEGGYIVDMILFWGPNIQRVSYTLKKMILYIHRVSPYFMEFNESQSFRLEKWHEMGS